MATATNETENIRTINEMKEQEVIVSRYELGRDEGAEIDAWEDPSFEVYHVTDHHGFIHQDKIPEQIARLDSKLLETKLNREKKWLAMTKSNSHWEKAVKTNKVIERTYKGIPEKVRGVAWCLMLGIKGIQERNPGVYERMRDLSKKWSTYIKQIDLDINRTFREHIMFRKRYDIKQQALFNVLCAYSLYDQDVGYCQGMSEVAALFLMFMNEEEAFWCFATLMTNEKHNMRGFFLPSFPKLIRFKDHHDEIVRKNFKKVKKHLDKNNVHTVTFCIKWFMQCFLDRFYMYLTKKFGKDISFKDVPFSLALRLWDIYIWEGEGLLIAGAYTIIRLQRDRLVKMSDEEILRLFQSDLAKDFGCSDEFVIKTLKLSMNDLRQSNKLIPKRMEGMEGFNKSLGCFTPPKVSDVACLEATPRVATLKSATSHLKTARVSIPADGGPELGVDFLIRENETGWRTMDRFLSQECFDDMAEKSDNSPLFSMRQIGDDGLSSCTSLASHDCENSSFYEGDDDFPANRDGHGSPDTLNGSNDVNQIGTENGEDAKNKFDGNLTIKADDHSDSRKIPQQLIIPPLKSILNPGGACSDPESLHPNDKHLVQNALAFYKTIPTYPGVTNNLSKGYPKVPCNSYVNHINSSNPLPNHKMPYSQSSLNIKNELCSIAPEKNFPGYPDNHTTASSTPSGTPVYNTFRKNTSSSSSYLGKKVMHKNVQRDQNKIVAKQNVSTVVIGEKSDVILNNHKFTSVFPSSPKDKTNGEGGAQSYNIDVTHASTSDGFGGESKVIWKEPTMSTNNTSNKTWNFHHSTSDLTHEDSSFRRFVSSGPPADTSLYHPDYKGVTRIWTGSPASSTRYNNPIKPVILKQRKDDSNVYSSPSNKADGKNPVFYTRF